MSPHTSSLIQETQRMLAGMNVLVLGDSFQNTLHPFEALPQHRLDGPALASLAIHQLGGIALPVGLLGTDPAGLAIKTQLNLFGIETGHLTSVPEWNTPSGSKSDGPLTPNAQPLGDLGDVEAFLFDQILHHLPQIEAILILDYGHGFLTPTLFEKLDALEVPTSIYIDQPFPKSALYPSFEWALLSETALRWEDHGSIPAAVRNAATVLNAAHTLVDSVAGGGHLFSKDQPMFIGCPASQGDRAPQLLAALAMAWQVHRSMDRAALFAAQTAPHLANLSHQKVTVF